LSSGSLGSSPRADTDAPVSEATLSKIAQSSVACSCGAAAAGETDAPAAIAVVNAVATKTARRPLLAVI
jgi:phosphomevalonate kinase